MKALYYPFVSPSSQDTLLRGLLLYEEIGAIQPKHLFLSGQRDPGQITTEFESLYHQCETYSGHNPLFILDPLDLLKGENEDLFTNSVVSDMEDEGFRSVAPKGTMTVYADKLTRDLFERFRDQIKPIIAIGPPRTSFAYAEGPYLGKPHFIWTISEPLAHSILLNLTMLGLNKTGSVPITDSEQSQRAFLFKTSSAAKAENVRSAAESLLKVALPSSKSLDVRKILDFRDKHKNEVGRFWTALTEEQEKLGGEFDQGNTLFANTRVEYQNLKDSLEGARSDLKWDFAEISCELILGFSGIIPLATVIAGGHATLKTMKYLSRRYKRTTGLSYLLRVAKL